MEICNDIAKRNNVEEMVRIYDRVCREVRAAFLGSVEVNRFNQFRVRAADVDVATGKAVAG